MLARAAGVVATRALAPRAVPAGACAVPARALCSGAAPPAPPTVAEVLESLGDDEAARADLLALLRRRHAMVKRAEVFGGISPRFDSQRSGSKILRQPLAARAGPGLIEMDKVIRKTIDPGFRSVAMDYWEQKAKRMRLRGKGPPKKGAGKRKSKKK